MEDSIVGIYCAQASGRLRLLQGVGATLTVRADIG